MSRKDYPDYMRGSLDKGFILIDVQEINNDVTVNAGFVGQLDIITPNAGEFVELLILVVFSDEVPNAVPAIHAQNVIDGLLKKGVNRALTLGETTNLYEMDLTDKRITVFKTANLDQRLEIELTAHASNNTEFKIRGLYARYTFAV